MYLNGLPSQDCKVFCSLHKESGEISAENRLHLVDLLNTNTHADRIDGWLDEAALFLRSADQNGLHYGKL